MIPRACAVPGHVGAVAGQGPEHLRRHPPDAFRGRLHRTADVALPQGEDVDKGLVIDTERHRPPQLGAVERGLRAVDEQSARQVGREHVADRLRRLALQIPQQWDRHAEDLIECAGDKSQDARRQARDDRPLDAVEIGPARLPVIRVSRHPDVLVRPEFDEFERAGADRMRAHVARADVTRVHRRPAGRQQRQKRGLRLLQMEGNLKVAVGGHLFEVTVPGLARIEAKLLDRLAGQQIPSAFDVLGGERPAVVPSDIVAQWQGQLGPLLVP
jgi:hypothetical protein